MKQEILKKLIELEKRYNVTILLAVESGSREWGFSSEDSDYDVRCVHVGKRDDYLGIKGVPDQLDLIDGEIDIVSWDIKKFFNLFLKSNPTVSEWLSSEQIYLERKFGKSMKKDIARIFSKDFNRSKLVYHYLSLARENYEKYINTKNTDSVLLKKYVYILRALGCVEFINKKDTLPPLNWKLSSAYLPNEIKKEFEELVQLKQKTEKTKDKRKEQLDKWIESKLRAKVKEDSNKFDEEQINQILIDTINSYS